MFGLTFEKLLLIAVVAAFLLGPDRLPAAAQALARVVRGAKSFVTNAKERVRDEVGPEFDEVDWNKLDPRRYDPRRIVREALAEPVVRPPSKTVRGSAPVRPTDAAPANERAPVSRD